MHVKTALNCLFLITGFKLLKLLSVVCEFGWQTNVCKNYIQNICSVVLHYNCTGSAEHIQIKWIKAYAVGIICPPPPRIKDLEHLKKVSGDKNHISP